MHTMRAVTVEPGIANSLRLEEFWVPSPDKGSVLIRGLALGVCGTDREIIADKYGAPPPGHKRLIIGHESLGRVAEAPRDAAVSPGDIVVGMVRHPDPVPCANCSAGEWDMCSNAEYTEHGIKALDGFGSEYYRMSPEFVVKVHPDLGDLAVLTEPASVVAKAWEHVERIGRRAGWFPRRVLVTGAGPIGLLAALMGRQRDLDVHVFDRATDGPKPGIVRELGATFHNGSLDELPRDFDVVIECTGAAALVLGVVSHTAPNGIVCLTGVSDPGTREKIDVGELNRSMVLGNRVVFGSVNANRRHYEAAGRALFDAPRDWLRCLITRRVGMADFAQAFEKETHDIKTIIDLGGAAEE